MNRDKRGLKDAIIDISVICMGCQTALYSGAYYPGVIGKLKRKIHKAGWKHSPTEGTLCPDCFAEIQEEEQL